MHANTEQLLEIKDGIENDFGQHVDSCDYCKSELEAICLLAKQVFISANQRPPLGAWDKIISGSADQRKCSSFHQPETEVPFELIAANATQPSRFNSLSTAVYTLAGSILVTGFIGLFIFGQQNSTNQQTQVLQASIQELMLNSRGMEQVLQKVALRNELISTDDQYAAERLYWRLTHLDQMIQDNNDSPERIQTLWNGRIDALNQLSNLYYQQQTLDDSEI